MHTEHTRSSQGETTTTILERFAHLTFSLYSTYRATGAILGNEASICSFGTFHLRPASLVERCTQFRWFVHGMHVQPVCMYSFLDEPFEPPLLR